MIKLKTEREYDEIRGKMLVNHATAEELCEFLKYVNVLESLLEDADNDDYFGTEGWRHRMGLEHE